MREKKHYGTFNDFSSLMLNFFMLSVGTITISIAVSLGTEQIRFTNKFLDYNFTDTIRNKYKDDEVFQEYVRNSRIIVYFLVSMILIYGIITTFTFGFKFWDVMNQKNRPTTKWFFKNYPEATFLLINITFSISIGILAFDIRSFPDDKYGLFDSYTNFFIYPLIHFDAVTASTFLFYFQSKAIICHSSTVTLTSCCLFVSRYTAGCCGIYTPRELLFDGIVENTCDQAEFQTILFPKWRHNPNLTSIDSKLELFAPPFCGQHFNIKSETEKLHDPCTIDPIAIAQTHDDSMVDPITLLPKIYSLGCIKKLSVSFVSLLYTAFLLSTISLLVLFVSIFIKFITRKTTHDIS